MTPSELHALRDVHRKLPLEHHTTCEVCQLLTIIDTQTRLLARHLDGISCQFLYPSGYVCGQARSRHRRSTRHEFLS